MKYVNQLAYRDTPYEHDQKRGGAPPDKRNVATSGCGICSLCMIVENLTDRRLSACVDSPSDTQ